VKPAKIIEPGDAVRIAASPTTNYIARTIYYADNVAILESDSGKWIEWPLTDLEYRECQ
jgi:DeoR/GlpR family transcriptional regulator of sugar metabolism